MLFSRMTFVSMLCSLMLLLLLLLQERVKLQVTHRTRNHFRNNGPATWPRNGYRGAPPKGHVSAVGLRDGPTRCGCSAALRHTPVRAPLRGMPTAESVIADVIGVMGAFADAVFVDAPGVDAMRAKANLVSLMPTSPRRGSQYHHLQPDARQAPRPTRRQQISARTRLTFFVKAATISRHKSRIRRGDGSLMCNGNRSFDAATMMLAQTAEGGPM